MRPPQYAVCDPGSGQPNACSLMDYAMSRADDLTSFDLGFNGPRCRTNPLGIKGCGEAGAIAAPAAVINALTNAIGTEALAMPATAQSVWSALQKVSTQRAAAA
jgi:carbon-monoxide dehydrogenase large subunit